MFNAEPADTNSGLTRAIDEIFREMAGVTADSEEYSAMADQLVKLYSLKETDSPKRITPDTLALVAGNLLGIVLIVGYEQKNVVTSKALNFVMKLR